MSKSAFLAILAATWMSGPALGAPLDGCAENAGGVVETSGSVIEDGQAGRFERYVALGSGRSRVAIDLGIITRGSGFDGTSGWSQDVSGATHELNSGFARALTASQAWLDARQGCPPDNGASWQPMGVITEAGETFDAWRVIPIGGAPLELMYNRMTHRLDRAALQEAETRLVRHFTDWRQIDHGTWVAFTERDAYIEDESEVVFHTERAVVTAAAPMNAFARPAEPRDAHILRGKSVTDIAYADDHRTRIYVPVYLNGHGPYIFELDNGGHFILDAKTAAAIGVLPQGAFSSTGAGNTVARVGFVHVAEVRIGDATLTGQSAKVRSFSDAANDRQPNAPRAGILGLELFERFTVAIDRHRKLVSLRLRGTPYPQPAGHALPLLFDDDAPLVRGTIAGKPGNLMLDTGNAGATIVEDFWAQRNDIAGQLAMGLSAGDGVRYGRGDVQLGDLPLTHETLSSYGAAERGSEYTRSVAAILGEPLLSRLNAVYDYARGLVWLDQSNDPGALPFNRAGLVLDKHPNGDFAVRSVFAGSPAARAGWKKGDMISEIGGRPAKDMSRADAAALFRQPVGTQMDGMTLEELIK